MVTLVHSRLRRTRGLVAAVVAAVVFGALAVGCGEADDPTEAVPALSDQLEDVDTAIGEHDYPAARQAIDELVRTTTQAREAGAINAEQADAIMVAAARLEAQLPPGSAGAPSEDEPGAGGTAAPSATETANAGHGDSVKGHGKGHDKGKGSGKGKGHD